MLASNTFDLNRARLLLRADASPNASDSFGETALMEAAGLGNINMCQVLLDARASITQNNEFNLTAMDFAEDPAVSELFNKFLSASLATDLPTAARSTSARPSLLATVVGSNRNSTVGVVRDVAVGPSRSSVSSNQDVRQFEWLVPIEQARSLRKGDMLESKPFKLARVPCSLQIAYYPKGHTSAKRGSCSIGILTGPGVEPMVAEFEVFLNSTSLGILEVNLGCARLFDICMPLRNDVTLKVALVSIAANKKH